MSKKQKYWLWGLSVLFLLLLALFVYLLLAKSKEDKKNNVNSYDECVKAGNPILESFPEQCKTPDGKTFVNSSAVSTSTSTTSSNTNSSSSTSENSSSSSSAESVTVKVYFSKDPSSMDDPNVVVAVDRTTTRTDIATFAIEELIDGPSATEQVNGLFTPLVFTGASSCSGKDFTLSISSGKATLQLCKIVELGGVLDGERVRQTVEKTLKQFSTVTKVVILNRDGSCFNDLSGQDLCKS